MRRHHRGADPALNDDVRAPLPQLHTPQVPEETKKLSCPHPEGSRPQVKCLVSRHFGALEEVRPGGPGKSGRGRAKLCRRRDGPPLKWSTGGEHRRRRWGGDRPRPHSAPSRTHSNSNSTPDATGGAPSIPTRFWLLVEPEGVCPHLLHRAPPAPSSAASPHVSPPSAGSHLDSVPMLMVAMWPGRQARRTLTRQIPARSWGKPTIGSSASASVSALADASPPGVTSSQGLRTYTSPRPDAPGAATR